jgi:hypothetical protein
MTICRPRTRVRPQLVSWLGALTNPDLIGFGTGNHTPVNSVAQINSRLTGGYTAPFGSREVAASV